MVDKWRLLLGQCGGVFKPMMYAVEGVDHNGRRFVGLYTKEDASYLVSSGNGLNRIVSRQVGRMVDCDLLTKKEGLECVE